MTPAITVKDLFRLFSNLCQKTPSLDLSMSALSARAAVKLSPIRCSQRLLLIIKIVKSSELITANTPTGTALVLQWQGYHVFSIPQRDFAQNANPVRFFGVGGKRQGSETFAECALRESTEEIGAVVSRLESAAATLLLKADGSSETLEWDIEEIQPRFILEKRQHSTYGSMAHQTLPYYMVAFDACLVGQPIPQNEIAALLYVTDDHLRFIDQTLMKNHWVMLTDLLAQGAQIETQADQPIAGSTRLTPQGTAKVLMRQLA
jgi:8-oxo-dGTP pyrophosphatase MutT (NUDIX family)